MRVLNLTGKGRNIGHGPNSPSYLEDETVVSLIEQAQADGYGGVRWNWAFDSMCPEPGVIDVSRLIFIVREIAARGMFAWAVHGSGPYPNQPKWRRMAADQSWHPCLTPLALHRRVIELINQALYEVWVALVRMGVDPRLAFALGCGNEHGDGGNGDPTRWDYTKPKNGTGKLSTVMALWLEELALSVNTLGMPMVSPGMELQAASAHAEIADLCGYRWMRRFDAIDVHCYDDIAGSARDKLASVLSLLAIRDDYIAGRPVWVGETGGNGDPRMELNALLSLGVERAGWLSP